MIYYEGQLSGVTREEFEDYFQDVVASMVPRYPDPEREEDIVQAGLFQYTPWPYKDDIYLNRDAIGQVNQA